MVLELLRRVWYAFMMGLPQNTTETNVLKMKPAPYIQQTAGNEYRIACGSRDTRRWKGEGTLRFIHSLQEQLLGLIIGSSHEDSFDNLLMD